MRVSKRIKAVVVLLLSSLALLIATPILVHAIADPDSPPAISAVYVYENCLESGDVGVLIDYYLDYAILPTVADPNDTATNAYIASFVDTDGATQRATVAPYTYQDSGYGRGLIWIYFTAAEVIAYSIDSANVVDYEIWLTGNPTVASGWAGVPPKTIAGIDQWNTIADPSTLIARRVLYYADQLELIWSLNLIETTSIGSRLTVLGEGYFESVITNLRTIAPAAFSAGTVEPTPQDIDYSTTFGAVASNGTATVVGSPQTLVSGNNTVDTGATVGTIILTLEQGTIGTITDGTGTVTGSPVSLVPGINTVTVTVAGTFGVEVALSNTQVGIDDATTGTTFDLSALALLFGLSTAMLSGLAWLLVTVVICAGAYNKTSQVRSGGGRVVFLLFTVCVVIGTLIGMLPLLVGVLLGLASGVFTAYILFFRGASI